MVTVHLHWILETKLGFTSYSWSFWPTFGSLENLEYPWFWTQWADVQDCIHWYFYTLLLRNQEETQHFELGNQTRFGVVALTFFFPLIFLFSLTPLDCNNFIDKSVVSTYGNYNIIWDDLGRTSLKIWTREKFLCGFMWAEYICELSFIRHFFFSTLAHTNSLVI